jgi:hypothetical protein
LDPTHAPFVQTSVRVQALPSLQAFELLVKTQPVAGLQVSVVQVLRSSQAIAVPWQTPPLHVSPDVQALPSSQAFELLVKAQPVAGLHVSFVQALPSLQTVAVPGWHVPPPHVSPVVHALPSSQEFVFGTETQPDAGLHVSVVHGLESSQTIEGPP